MRTLGIVTFSCALGGCLMMLMQGNASAAKEPPGKVLRHMVLYKFKEGVSSQQTAAKR